VAVDREIRLLVVEDQPIMRRGLVTVLDLEPGFHVVGEADRGDLAVTQARTLRPDVVLMDVQLPGGMDGVAATAQIIGQQLGRVLILTTFDTEDYVLDAIAAGAAGYVLKDVDAGQLCDVIRRIAQGEVFVQPSVAIKYLRKLSTMSPVRTMPDSEDHSLSPREMEVLRLLGQGLSNREIAQTLYIAESTVKNHVNAILSKLRVSNRTSAAWKARRWLEDGPPAQ